jgi:hypothetical protein
LLCVTFFEGFALSNLAMSAIPNTQAASVTTHAQPFAARGANHGHKVDQPASRPQQKAEKPPSVGPVPALGRQSGANFVDVTFSDFAAEPMAPRPGPTPFFVALHAAETFPAKRKMAGDDQTHGVLPKHGQPEPRKPSRSKSVHARKHAGTGREEAGAEREPGGRSTPFRERRKTESSAIAYSRRESDTVSGRSSTTSTPSRRTQRRLRDKENVDLGPPIVFAGPVSKAAQPLDKRTQSYPMRVENVPPSLPKRRSVRLSLTRGLRYDADDCDTLESGADYQDDDYLLFVAPPSSLRKAPSTLNSYLSRLVHHKSRD